MVEKLFCDYCGEEIEYSKNLRNYEVTIMLVGKYKGEMLKLTIATYKAGSGAQPDICMSCLKTALTNILSK